MRPVRYLVTLAAALAALAGPAAAQQQAEARAARSLTLELNAFAAVAGGCRVTFLATNGMGTAIDDAAFEVGFFGKDGVLGKLVSLDFKAMPEGKSKVLQFDLDGLVCADIGRVLVNDVATCSGDGLDPATCLADLRTSSLPDVIFGI